MLFKLKSRNIEILFIPILKLASGKFLYSDKVDLTEPIVFPLFNIAVKRFNADTVTGLLVSTSIGSIMRFWCISNLYSPRSQYRESIK
jgi:hypothetical protein